MQGGLPGQLQALAQCLESNGRSELGLKDIAAATELLVASMESYFKSIDTLIYREFRELSDYIDNARKEIAALKPADQTTSRLPRAGAELDAIVKATEEATHEIMSAAEDIMGADPSNPGTYDTVVNDAVMRIFESCSFQDITGQRIGKVIETLTYLENRINELSEVWGVSDREVSEDEIRATTGRKDGEVIISGPALDGEGIDQGQIDAILGSSDNEVAASSDTDQDTEIDALLAGEALPGNGKTTPECTEASKTAAGEKNTNRNSSARVTTDKDIKALFG